MTIHTVIPYYSNGFEVNQNFVKSFNTYNEADAYSCAFDKFDIVESKISIVTTIVQEAVINQISADIVADLDNEGLGLVEDQRYGINANEIYLKDITYNKYLMNKVITHVLESHFAPME
jgi:hypothetical protein